MAPRASRCIAELIVVAITCLRPIEGGPAPSSSRPPSTRILATRRHFVAFAAATLALDARGARAEEPTPQSLDRLRRAAVATGDGDVAEAERLTKQVIELQPGYAGGYAGRASLAVQRGDYAAALGDYDKALDLGPADGEESSIRLNRGCTLMALDRPSDAIAEFDRALALKSPYRPTVIVNRALALMDLGREGEAFENLKALIASQGQAVEPYWLLYALLLSERDGLAEATGLLKRVQLKFGQVDDVHAALALVFAQAGKLDDARVQWQRVGNKSAFESADRLVRKPRRWPRASAKALVGVIPKLEP